MSSKRFVPCAGVIIGLFGLGGQVLRDDTSAFTWFFVAGFYLILAATIIALRNRIAAWWNSSTLLPCGCALLLLLSGVSALSHVDWQHLSPRYTNSSVVPAATPSGSELPSYRHGDVKVALNGGMSCFQIILNR